MGIIDLQIYNFLMVFIYNLQPFQTKNYIYNLQEIQENNCRFYNQYRAKSTIYKKPGPPPPLYTDHRLAEILSMISLLVLSACITFRNF